MGCRLSYLSFRNRIRNVLGSCHPNRLFGDTPDSNESGRFKSCSVYELGTFSGSVHPVENKFSPLSLFCLRVFFFKIMNWVVAFTTPLFLAKSRSGAYFMFGSFSFLAVAVSFALLPESRGVHFADLDSIFKVSPWRKYVNRVKNSSIALEHVRIR
jgi:hypothetical protein